MCDGFCLWYDSYRYISVGISEGGGFIFSGALSVVSLANAIHFFLVSLLVGTLSNLHCVFFDGPLCYLIFLVNWCSVLTVVFVIFLFLLPLVLLFHFNFSFFLEGGFS